MNLNDAFPSKYLKTGDLKGRDVTLTIESVDIQKLPNNQGLKLVAGFEGKDKEWIINKTNANTIANVLGSADTEDWIGRQITLYPTETEFQGQMVDCIRVRRQKASTAPQAPRTPPPEPEYDDQVPF